jgi:hypothetical protein
MTTAISATTLPAPAGRPADLLDEARWWGVAWARAEGLRRRWPGHGPLRTHAERACDRFQSALLRLTFADRSRDAKRIVIAARTLADRYEHANP